MSLEGCETGLEELSQEELCEFLDNELESCTGRRFLIKGFLLINAAEHLEGGCRRCERALLPEALELLRKAG